VILESLSASPRRSPHRGDSDHSGQNANRNRGLEGNGQLERVLWRDGTGAVTSTGWLNGRVALDAKGFSKTGTDLTREDLAAAQRPLERSPYLLETSRPGVFAVGDVRCGNIKRVASAVGEGSIAISFVHRVLAA
jgi:thioredoxin reductase (NADPH)